MLLVVIVGVMTADPDPVDACRAAVHGDLAKAISACASPEGRVDILKPAGLDEACLDALAAGRQAGKFGPSLPQEMRNGLILQFDKKEATCRAPRAQQTPERKVTQLWD